MADAEGNVYVYGVASAAERASLPDAGVAGAGVRIVEHDGLAALVSDLDSGTLVAAREVRAHWRVIEAAATSTTVLWFASPRFLPAIAPSSISSSSLRPPG